MKCIYCGHEKTKVADSVKSNRSVLRKRVCLSCGKEFYTEETSGTLEKQNGIRGRLRHFRELNQKWYS